jgi:hypothetical protein
MRIIATNQYVAELYISSFIDGINSLCEFVSASNNQQMNAAAGYIGEVRLIFALAQKLASLSPSRQRNTSCWRAPL